MRQLRKKRSARLRVRALLERNLNRHRLCDYDWVYGRLLDLAGQKQCYRAVVVLIIGVMMDEFMQAWTDYQDRSPLEHRNQKQSDNLRRGVRGEFLGSRLLGFSLSVHWTP